MKIILGILSGILLLCLIGIGMFFFMQNQKKNTVGSMMKDRELEVCVRKDINDVVENLEGSVESAIAEASSDISEATTTGDIITNITENVLEPYDDQKALCTTEREMVAAALVPVIAKIIEQATNEAREKAQIAGAKASLSSTVPAVILCVDDQKYVNEPVAGKNICEGEDARGTWPDLSGFNATWGGCEMTVDKANGTFEYCATLPDQIGRCTMSGCTFK